MNIGYKVKHLRLKHGISQEKLSRDVFNSSQAYVSKIESNAKTVTVDKLKCICDYFGISLMDFFADEDDNTITFFLNKIRKLNEKEKEIINDLLDYLLEKKEVE